MPAPRTTVPILETFTAGRRPASPRTVPQRRRHPTEETKTEAHFAKTEDTAKPWLSPGPHFYVQEDDGNIHHATHAELERIWARRHPLQNTN